MVECSCSPRERGAVGLRLLQMRAAARIGKELASVENVVRAEFTCPNEGADDARQEPKHEIRAHDRHSGPRAHQPL